MIRFTKTTLVAGLASALMVLGAAPTMAAPAADGAAATVQQDKTPRAERQQRRALTPEQRQQAMAQRMDAFKQKLQITPQQQGAWDAFVQAMQPSQHARIERQDLRKLTTPERVDHMRALRAQQGADADRRGDALKTLYAALTPDQQKTLDEQGNRWMAKDHRGSEHRGHAMKHHRGDHQGWKGHGPRHTPQQAPQGAVGQPNT